MKKKTILNKGFTLTEVLLAVMIVGLIGIALASLSRGASRESGIGRSRMMLRNNMSIFMRQLRSDMENATYVEVGNIGDTTGKQLLLKLGKGVDKSGAALSVRNKDGNLVALNASNVARVRWVTYCFQRGTAEAYPQEGSYKSFIGGKIWRYEGTDKNVTCTGGDTPGEVVLSNVKYIPAGLEPRSYPVPRFNLTNNVSEELDTVGRYNESRLDVYIITELNSNPPINDVMEERFPISYGY